MAKIAKKLTDTEIKSTKPADKEINLFDGVTNGAIVIHTQRLKSDPGGNLLS